MFELFLVRFRMQMSYISQLLSFQDISYFSTVELEFVGPQL